MLYLAGITAWHGGTLKACTMNRIEAFEMWINIY